MPSIFRQTLFMVDLFKSPIFLFVNKKEKNSTSLGSFLSILIFAYLGITFFNSDVFKKTHPAVIDQSQMPDNRPKISLNSSNFALSIGLSDTNSIGYHDPSIFTVAFLYNIIDGENVTNEYRSLHLCNDSDFPNNPDAIKNLRLDNYYCLDNSEFDLEGYWDERKLSYVMIALLLCQNSTGSPIICKSKEEIDKFLKEKYFGIYYQDNNYDMSDFKNPISSVFKTDYALIDPIIRKKLTINYKFTEITDDKGLLFDQENSINTFKKDSILWDFDSRSYGDQMIFVICLYSSEYKQKVNRRYQKLQDAISNMGGSASVLIMIGTVLTKLQNKLNLTNYIMNQLYNFQPIPENFINNNKKNKHKNKNSKLKNPSSVENINLVQLTAKQNNPVFTLKQIQLVSSSEQNPDEIQNQNKNQQPAKISSNKNEIVKIEQKPINDDSFILENYSKNSLELSPIDLKQNQIFFPLSNEKFGNSPKSPKTRRNSNDGKRCILKKMTTKLFQTNNDMHSRKSKNFAEYAASVQKESKITMKIWQYIKLKIKKLIHFDMKPEEQLFYKAQTIFKRELDIINILRRLQDVEKLKIVLLNEKQLSLFDLLAKPMIYLEEHTDTQQNNKEESPGLKIFDKMESSVTYLKNFPQKKEMEKMKNFKYILNSYKQTINSKNLTDVDRRLLKLVDKNLEDFCLHYGSNEEI